MDRGKKIYATQCALCHGDKGDGKGELAADMKLNVPDFTKPDTLKDRTDGELFAIIGTGKDPMPSQGRPPDRNAPLEPGELPARSFRQSAREIHGKRARGEHHPGSRQVDLVHGLPARGAHGTVAVEAPLDGDRQVDQRVASFLARVISTSRSGSPS